MGSTVVQWVPHNKRVLSLIPGGVTLLSMCLRGVSPSTPASSHISTKWKWSNNPNQLELPSCGWCLHQPVQFHSTYIFFQSHNWSLWPLTTEISSVDLESKLCKIWKALHEVSSRWFSSGFTSSRTKHLLLDFGNLSQEVTLQLFHPSNTLESFLERCFQYSGRVWQHYTDE